jgi:hypothetical protein
MGGSSKKVTVGYKYYVGEHMVICKGPVDYVGGIRIDKRQLFNGVQTEGSITVSKENLFGGKEREGGVSGKIDFAFGGDSQTQNSYLSSKLGSNVPAFRGVLSAILNRLYLGTNPYLKPWDFRVQRIHTRQNGIAQWNDSKSEILAFQSDDYAIKEDFSDGLTPYVDATPNGFNGSKSEFSLGSSEYGTTVEIPEAIWIEGESSHPQINRDYGLSIEFTRVEAKLRLNSKTFQGDDSGGVGFLTSGGTGVIGFGIRRQYEIDNLQRPNISHSSQPLNPGNPVGTGEVELGVWYQFRATYNKALGRVTGSVTNLETGLEFGSVDFYTGARGTIGEISFSNDDVNGTSGSCSITDVRVLDEIAFSDMNPAHIIRECITDPDWGMGYLDADVDDSSFELAANTLYSEDLGVSILWDKQVKLEDFIIEVLRHIDAALYVDRTTGKFVLKLIRSDYVESSLSVFDETNIISVKSYSRPTSNELINKVTVVFENVETGENEVVSVDDPSLVLQYGGVNSTTIQYPGFSVFSTASKAAARDLKTLSSPILSATLTINREASSLNVGDVFKFIWNDYHDGYIVMRVKQIALGDGKSNLIQVTCSEDVFSTPQTSITVREIDAWEQPVSIAGDIDYVEIHEASYYELVFSEGQESVDSELSTDNSIGYINVSVAHSSDGNFINGELWVDSGGGYIEVDQVDFCPVGVVSTSYSKTDTTLSFSSIENIDEISIGSHGIMNGEIMSIVSFDSELNTIDVHRGVLDTLPKIGNVDDVFVIYSDYSASNDIQYVDGESIDIKVTSLTGQGRQDLVDATAYQTTMDSRAIRPYPPGNLQINSLYFPTQIQDSIAITWAHRDRLQQTASHFAYTTGDVGPEAGTTYDISVKYSDDTVLESATGLTGTSFTVTNPIETIDDILTIELQTFRDGFESRDKYLFDVQYADSTAYTPDEDFSMTSESYTPSNNFTF